MKEAIGDTMVALRLLWFRVSCYFLIPAATSFLSVTETWSQETWESTGPFLKVRLAVSCFIGGATALVAFIDSSFQRSRKEIADQRVARTGDTETIVKDGATPSNP